MQLKTLATKYGKGAITKPLYLYETWLRLTGRTIQLIAALVVLGIYGSRIHSDHEAFREQAIQWVYAVGVAGLSATTAILFAIPQPFFKTARLFAWDFFLFILWIIVFAIFAVIFLRMPDDDAHKWYRNTRVSVMRPTVWLDLANAVLWLLTGGYGCFRTFVSRKVDETIDGKINDIEARVSDTVASSGVGVKLESAANFANAAMPYVQPLAPTVSKFTGLNRAH